MTSAEPLTGAAQPVEQDAAAQGLGYGAPTEIETRMMRLVEEGEISRLLGDPSARERLTAMARARVKDNYDFDRMKGRKNPYAGRLKSSVTIRLDRETVAYFKRMAQGVGIPYQTLINLYLRDCAASNRRLRMGWKPAASKATS